MSRKIVQIAVGHEVGHCGGDTSAAILSSRDVVALADDGTVWVFEQYSGYWDKLPDLPQEEING
jgi:hypothetical protein